MIALMIIDDPWWKFFDHHNINPASLNDVAWVKKKMNSFCIYIQDKSELKP